MAEKLWHFRSIQKRYVIRGRVYKCRHVCAPAHSFIGKQLTLTERVERDAEVQIMFRWKR